MESQEDFKYQKANSYNLLRYSEVFKNFKAIWADNFVLYSPCIICTYCGREAPPIYFSKMLQSTSNVCSMKSYLVSSESIIKHYWMLSISSVSPILEFQFTATLMVLFLRSHWYYFVFLHATLLLELYLVNNFHVFQEAKKPQPVTLVASRFAHYNIFISNFQIIEPAILWLVNSNWLKHFPGHFFHR